MKSCGFEDLVILVEGPDVYVENIEESSDGFEIKIHGSGEAELLTQFIDRRRGDTWTMTGSGARIGKRGAWDIVHVEFHGCSVGGVRITTEPCEDGEEGGRRRAEQQANEEGSWMRLENQVAVVVGSSSGMGRATAVAFAAAGGKGGAGCTPRRGAERTGC